MEFKKKLKLRLYAAIVYVLIGAMLIILSCTDFTDNEILSSFGAGFAVIGIGKIVQYIRITKDNETLHAREVAEMDERNIMIMTKARSLAFSIFFMLSGIAVVVLYILNLTFAAQIVACTIGAFTLIYRICYHIISRKY